MDPIEHFSHRHMLTFSKMMHYTNKCMVCDRLMRYGEGVYGCNRCGHFIDKSCAELPQTLKHPFHPHHNLQAFNRPMTKKKVYIRPRKFTCNACGFRSESYGYECKECPFFLDIFCASLSPNSECSGALHPIGQPHPLFTCVKPAVYNRTCSCCSLTFSATDEVNVCIECNHVLHQSCASVKEINHPFHVQHPLVVVPPSQFQNNIKCSTCSSERNREGRLYMFQCMECDFALDFNCAALVPVPTDEVQQPDLNHEHHLIESKINNDKFWYNCGNCRLYVKDSVFVCLDCRILLHRECANLTREFAHPCHPQHPFQLKKRQSNHYYECWLCGGHSFSCFAYSCSCGIYLEPSCAVTKPAIINKTEFHEHPLVYFTELCSNSARLLCHKCNEHCKEEFFHCPLCRYSCHLRCYPHFPREIKDECHLHPLILSKVSTAKTYCNVCKKYRDSPHPTYRCKEGCYFVAHLLCVISQVLRCMEKERSRQTLGDVDSGTSLNYVQDEKATAETASSRDKLEFEEERDSSTRDYLKTSEVSVEEETIEAFDEAITTNQSKVNKLMLELEKLKVRRELLFKPTI